MRTAALLAAGFAVVAVAVLAIAGGGGDDGGGSPRGELPATATVAERLEALRGLRFERVPEVRVLDRAQAEEAGEEIARRQMEEAQKDPRKLEEAERQAAAAQELLALTGTIDPDEDLATALAGVEEQLGGIYDSASGEVLILEDAVEELGDKAEAIVAHELTHALEDQAFGTFEPGVSVLAEPAAARLSLIEGTATLAEIQYARRHLQVERTVTSILDRRERQAAKTPIPEPLRRAIAFPYVTGGRFAQELHRRGGWRLVNEAHRRPPVSTEQIIHPAKWRRNERPVKLPEPSGEALGRGWERIGVAELGELDTSVLLETGVSREEAERAAAGWGGARFSVWHHDADPDESCPPPCRSDTAAALLWAWDSPGEAREFTRAAARYVEKALAPSGAEDRSWRLEKGAVAFAGEATLTSLTFAPSPEVARRLAREALQPPRG